MARFVPIRNGSILACAHHAQLVWRQPTFRPHVGAAPVSLYVCQICAHAQRPHFGLRSFRTALRFPFLYCFFHLRALILVPARGYPLALQLFPQGSWLSTCTHGQKCVHEQRLHFSCRPFDTIWYFPFIPWALWQLRHRVGAPLWSPCGGMVDATPRWCSVVEPTWWDGGNDAALVLRCGARAVG